MAKTEEMLTKEMYSSEKVNHTRKTVKENPKMSSTQRIQSATQSVKCQLVLVLDLLQLGQQ